jgi:hypothetical protein
MSNQVDPQAAVRNARHAGFNNAVKHLDEQRRTRLTKSYTVQDARREQHVSKFVQNLKGA